MTGRLLVLALLILGVSPRIASAQHAAPVPLVASDPRAQRAAGMAKLILAGDRSAAEAYLDEYAEADYVKGRMSVELDAVLAQFAGGGYTVSGFLAAGDLVIVQLTGTRSARDVATPPAAESLAVGVSDAPPYLVRRLGRARIRVGGH